MYGDSMEPTFEADGSIKCYQAEPSADDEDEDEEETVPKRPVGIAPFTRFKREGLKLVEVEAWVSDAEKDRRVKREEYERKNEEWTRNFKNTRGQVVRALRLRHARGVCVREVSHRGSLVKVREHGAKEVLDANIVSASIGHDANIARPLAM
jgi:hypothetical protein